MNMNKSRASKCQDFVHNLQHSQNKILPCIRNNSSLILPLLISPEVKHIIKFKNLWYLQAGEFGNPEKIIPYVISNP